MNSIRTAITNNFVFNNPEFDYKKTNINSKSIIYIKKNKEIDNKIENYIPCLFIQEREQSSKFLIFFHGNSEDIFLSELIGQLFAEKLQMNVIIVEYPGYSIYNAPKNAEVMCYDSLKVYSFIQDFFNLKDEDIFVLGRSIGTGPAVYLASQKKPQALILISPFKSIKSIKGGFLGFFLLDIFKSIDIIGKVTSPILFIHGRNDHLIEYTHSEELLDKLKKMSNLSDLDKNSIFINDNMTHNEMDLEKDVLDKIIKFINKDKPFEPQKEYFNFMDKKFKKLFDVPLAVQKYLLTLNINLDKPNIEKMDSRFSLLLHDGRLALATNKYQIEIYDTEEMEIELKIKTNEIGLINSLYQLSNNLLVANSDFMVVFYSLKKYKYEEIKSIQFENSVIKVEELNNNIILILTKESLIVLDINNFKLIKTIKSKFQYIKVIPPYIALQTVSKVMIFKYQNNRDIKVKEIDLLGMENINYNLINIENKYFAFLDNNNLNFLSLIDIKLYYKKEGIFVQKPTFIFNLYNNMIIIRNENGDIQIFEVTEGSIKSILFKEAVLKSANKFKSITALKDGKLIISEVEKERYEIKDEETILNFNDNCLII
jgi:esterase/lipase